MRPSPAYKAVEALQDDSSFKYRPESLEDRQGNHYFMIPFCDAAGALTMGGKNYQPSQAPHVSVYECYRTENSKVRGLDVFHYTWYGETETASVVLHVYFSRSGQYLDCQLKNRETDEVIDSISPPEEAAIRRHCQVSAGGFFQFIYDFVCAKYKEAAKSAEKLLSNLEDIAPQIKTQIERYKGVAKRCIVAIENKDVWTFGRYDSEAKFLTRLIDRFDKIEVETQNQPRLFQAEETTSVRKKKRPKKSRRKPKGKQKRKKTSFVSPPLSEEIKSELAEIDSKIIASEEDQEKTDVERALLYRALLSEKQDVLSNAPIGSGIEYEAALWRQLKRYQKQIEELFEMAAREGDLNTLETLSPFYSSVIPLSFFFELFKSEKIGSMEFLIQHFDECLLYVNHFLISFPDKKSNSNNDDGVSFLTYALYLKNSDLFKMLLRNGAYPDCQGGSQANSLSPLTIAIEKEDEECVRLLLQYGADPNKSITSSELVCISDGTPKDLRRAKRKALQERPDFILENKNQTLPLHKAIRKGNERLVALLLQYNASVTQKTKDGFDAMGVATCGSNLPNPEILKLLINHGADINAIQGEAHATLTALQFACQRDPGDLASVRLFVTELGADPNQLVSVVLGNKGGTITADSIRGSTMTPFLKAVTKEHTEIVKFLLEQQVTPLTFSTIVPAWVWVYANVASLDINQKTFTLVPNKAEFKFPIGLLLFKTFAKIKTLYDAESIKNEVQHAKERATEEYRLGYYDLAALSFFIPLFFGTKVERHNACGHLAGCMRKQNKPDPARFLFTHCMNHAPDSVMGKYSRKQIKKIEAAQIRTSI